MNRTSLNLLAFLAIFVWCAIFTKANAQNVGINTTGVAPHSSTMLDLNTGSTFTSPNGKGLLIPNVALTGTADATTIASAATSLLIYNTATAGASPANVVPGYYFWNGSKWIAFSGSGGRDWSLTGNAGTTAGTNFIGTIDNIDLVFKRNNGQAGIIQSDNTAYGVNALILNTGSNNTATGVDALQANTTGASNSAMGAKALFSNTDGIDNTANGENALYSNTTGDKNTAVGKDALLTNIGGSHNTAMGMNALYFNTEGVRNTAVGRSALKANTTGSSNTAVGTNALITNTTGGDNSAVGRGAMHFNTTGISNSAIGQSSLYTNTIGSNNTSLGWQSMFNSTEGINNTSVGSGALSSNTTGDNNVILGYSAGNNITTGSNNLIIGYDIDAPVATSNNQLSIGNLIFGTGVNGTGTTVSTGKIGIGTTTPANKLDVNGNITLSGASRIIDFASGAGDITSPTGIDLIIDDDNNSTGSIFRVRHDGGTTIFEVQEGGDIKIIPIASAPSGNEGEIYTDSGDDIPYYHDGTAWRPFMLNSNLGSYGWLLSGNSGTTAGTDYLGTTDAVDLVLSTAGTERVRINGIADGYVGFVGFGTTNPLQKVHVADDLILGGGQGGTEDGATEFLKIWAQSKVWNIGVINDAASANSDFFISQTDGAADGVFHIEPTGHIGIGTATPESFAKLHVEIDDTDDALYVKNTDATSNTNAVFRVDANSGLSNALRVQRDGKVGIGTTPSTTLHVAGDITIDGTTATPAASSTKMGYQHVYAGVTGDFFIHPEVDVRLNWNSTTNTLTFDNNDAVWWDVTIQVMNEGGSINHATNDVANGGTLTRVGGTAGTGWMVIAVDERASAPGFIFWGTGYDYALQGMIQYWY